MALKVTFDKPASLAEQLLIAQQVEEKVIRVMQYAGEKFVKEARSMTKSNGGFGDVTGNLRASISYYIRKDGEVILYNSNFGSTGALTSMSMLDKIPAGRGIQLIGIAGMDYASHVEARGFNVISLQADAAIIDLTRYYEEISRRFNR